jgi:hypothetical protein
MATTYRVYDFLGQGTGIFSDDKKVSLIAFSNDNIEWKSFGILTNLIASDIPNLTDPNFSFSLESMYFNNQQIDRTYVKNGVTSNEAFYNQLYQLSHIGENIDSTVWVNYLVFFDIYDNSVPFIPLVDYETIISDTQNPLRFNSQVRSGQIGGLNLLLAVQENKDGSILSYIIFFGVICLFIFLSNYKIITAWVENK